MYLHPELVYSQKLFHWVKGSCFCLFPLKNQAAWAKRGTRLWRTDENGAGDDYNGSFQVIALPTVVMITYEAFFPQSIRYFFSQVVLLIIFSQRRGTNHLAQCLIGMKSCVIGPLWHMSAQSRSSHSFWKRWENSPCCALPVRPDVPIHHSPTCNFNIIPLWFSRLGT